MRPTRLHADLSDPSLAGLLGALAAVKEQLPDLAAPCPLLSALAAAGEQGLAAPAPAELQAHADRAREIGPSYIAAGQAVCAYGEVCEALAQRENDPIWARRNVEDATSWLQDLEENDPRLGPALRAGYDRRRQTL